MKIAIYGSRRQDAYLSQLTNFLETLADNGADIIMHRKLYETLLPLIPMSLRGVRRVIDNQEFTADIALSFGGDGTFLRTAMWVGDKDIPVLGINTGHLGYLSGASISELPEVAKEILSGNITTVQRSLIELVSPKVATWPYAINEIAVAKEENASMIVADTTIDGAPLATYRADGLIVATPTGSTAYNLSVGGPIIQPSAPVWVISPIAAHSLGLRPLVLSDDCDLAVTVSGRAQMFRLSLDGRSVNIPIGTTVMLRRAPFSLRLVVRQGYIFPDQLRSKLGWDREGL